MLAYVSNGISDGRSSRCTLSYCVILYCTATYCISSCFNSPCRVATPSSHLVSSLLISSLHFFSHIFSPLLLSYSPFLYSSLPLSSHTFPCLLTGIGGSSSGGAAVAGILGFMGGYPDPLASEGFLYSQRLAEAYKHVFAVRYMYRALHLFIIETS
jgi:hypothetical protein